MYFKEKHFLSALQAGEKKAYEELFSRYWAKTVKYLACLLKDGAAAEDLAQNVFVKIWNTRDRLAEVKSLDSWVFTIAHNQACDHLRRTVQTESLLSASLVYNPQWGMDAVSLNDIVSDCVSAFPPQRRICYKLSSEEHLSNQEIADRLNLSRRTVEHHISFALKQIREALGNNFS